MMSKGLSICVQPLNMFSYRKANTSPTDAIKQIADQSRGWLTVHTCMHSNVSSATLHVYIRQTATCAYPECQRCQAPSRQGIADRILLHAFSCVKHYRTHNWLACMYTSHRQPQVPTLRAKGAKHHQGKGWLTVYNCLHSDVSCTADSTAGLHVYMRQTATGAYPESQRLVQADQTHSAWRP